MGNFIVGSVIAAILTGAIVYIRREKKRGVKCIGCPDGATCGGKCGSCSGCSGGCSK